MKDIPAFPTRERTEYATFSVDTFHDGMTLRDYFAAKALQAIITIMPFASVDVSETAHERFAALGAYGYADAMMKARSGE